MNQRVAAADEATNASVASDIPTSDANAGTGFWDDLKAAGSDLKLDAFDSLGAEEGTSLWAEIGVIALPDPPLAPFAIAAVAAVGVFAEIAGVVSGPPDNESSPYTATSVRAIKRNVQLDTFDDANASTDPSFCALSGPCTDVPQVTSSDGWVLQFQVNGQSGFEVVGQCSGDPEPNNVPPGFTKIEIAHQDDECGPYWNPTIPETWYVYWKPGQVTSLPGPGQGIGGEPNTSCLDSADNAGGCTLGIPEPTRRSPTRKRTLRAFSRIRRTTR